MTAALTRAIRPTVAIMGNGARKGGDRQPGHPACTPGLEDIWQVHYSAQPAKENINPPRTLSPIWTARRRVRHDQAFRQADGTYS
jgi:hypothetical protein